MAGSVSLQGEPADAIFDFALHHELPTNIHRRRFSNMRAVRRNVFGSVQCFSVIKSITWCRWLCQRYGKVIDILEAKTRVRLSTFGGSHGLSSWTKITRACMRRLVCKKFVATRQWLVCKRTPENKLWWCCSWHSCSYGRWGPADVIWNFAMPMTCSAQVLKRQLLATLVAKYHLCAPGG